VNLVPTKEYWQQYDIAPKDTAGDAIQTCFKLIDQFQCQQNGTAFKFTPAT
jgi:hypothetical protein